MSRLNHNRATIPALVLLAFATPSLGQRPAAPAVTAEFLSRLASAANRRDPAALKAFAVPDIADDFGWATEAPGMIGKPQPWQARVLTLPGAKPGVDATFVAFTKYHPCESAGDHLYRIALTPDGPRLRAEIPETDTLGTRVRQHRLTVRFDIPKQQAWVTDRVTVEHRNAALPADILRINAIYQVTGVKRAGRPVPYRQAGGFLAIADAGTGRAEFDLAYHATLDFSTEDYIRPNQAALTGYWYPHTGRLPATSEVSITAPRGWTSIGQGEPAGRTATAHTVTTSWKNTLPVSYLTVAAGKYTVTSRKVGGILVSAYLLHGGAKRAQETIRVASGALTWFSKNFSRFPYSRYAVVETDMFPAALECYSFTLAGRSLIPMAIVHEISHTWWGGIVPNTYTRSMWNESFAEYSDGLYGRQTGNEGMHEFNAQVLTKSGMIGASSLLTAKDAMDMGQSAVGYGKGSVVLENLERLLGTPKMLACMRRFIADHKRKRPGEDAEWKDFADAVAETAGGEWRAFFPPWLSRTDLPALALHDVKVERDGGRTVVTGTITQGSPAFWIAVPVVVDTSSGPSAQQVVAVKSSEQPFRIAVDGQPAQVALDPRQETLRQLASGGSTPSLLSLQTTTDPLVVVYATGGSPAENAAVKAVADGSLKDLFPFASITVRPDTEATADVLASGNVLLLGRAESLRVPADWKALLPLRYTDTAIALGGKQWQGGDLWGIAVVPHPTRKNALVAHAAGTGPGAIRNFEHQAELDSLKGLFVVRGAGTQVAAEPSRGSDATVVTLTP